MQRQIISLLSEDSYQPSTISQLLERLELSANAKPQLLAQLKLLMKKGAIERSKGNRYRLAEASSDNEFWTGTLQVNRAGKGFLPIHHPTHSELVIPEKYTHGALNGDVVKAKLRPGLSLEGSKDEKLNAEVVEIVERRTKLFVGAIRKQGRSFVVTPDNPRIPEILVPLPRNVGRPCHNGDKVVVEITDWGSKGEGFRGEVIEVLGAPDAEGVDMLSVIRGYSLDLHFPKKVLKEAEKVSRDGTLELETEAWGSHRKDCRKDRVITIDPDDAKDFDDAICLRKINSNLWKLWVHIADVSHYVKIDSALDKEAYHRGNSTYLVDRVVPMLPEALSNELCSLKPGVDRMTKCVEFSLNQAGKVLSAKFYSAVIHSKHRYTYQQALGALQRSPSGATEQMLHDANRFAQILRKKRFANGSLDLDFPENKIRLDEQGRVIRIEKMENDISHQLIEEFMLLANEAVATELLRRAKPGIFRVHEAPKKQRLADFSELLQSHHLKSGDLTKRDNIQRVLARLKELPSGQGLKIAFLRSLTRARYAAESLGHYGLAKDNYTHFTSPIRRYSDLVVHRLVFDQVPMTFATLKDIGDHLSNTEKNSAEAERDSRDVKLYAYLQKQIDDGQRLEYTATVTDLKSFGFTVDIEALGISGLVPLSSIRNLYYQLVPEKGALITRDPSKTIRLGDVVTVKVLKVDRESKLLDFQLATKEEFAKPSSRTPSRQGEERSKSKGSLKVNPWKLKKEQRKQERPQKAFAKKKRG